MNNTEAYTILSSQDDKYTEDQFIEAEQMAMDALYKRIDYDWHTDIKEDRPKPEGTGTSICVLCKIRAKNYPHQTFFNVLTYSILYGFMMCGYDRQYYEVIAWKYIEDTTDEEEMQDE